MRSERGLKEDWITERNERVNQLSSQQHAIHCQASLTALHQSLQGTGHMSFHRRHSRSSELTI